MPNFSFQRVFFSASRFLSTKKPNFFKGERTVQERFNWENELLYGPRIDSSHSRKVQNTISNIQSKRDVSSAKELDVKRLTASQKNLSEQDRIIPSGKPNFFPLTPSKNIELNELNHLAKNILHGNVVSPIPSVTRILQATMSAESVAVLERWKNVMIAKLGKEGFAKYQKETFNTGSSVHKAVYDFLTGVSESSIILDENTEGYWKSLSSVLPRISDVVSLETRITHPYLNYLGVADCVAKFENNIVLIEWKTSQKPKPTLKHTYDNPIQLAAYVGAWNFQRESDCEVKQGIIVVAYPTGKPAHVHSMTPKHCQQAWDLWIARLNEFSQFESVKRAESVLT